MRRYTRFLSVATILLLMFNGCDSELSDSLEKDDNKTVEIISGGGETEPNPIKVDKFFYGYWVNVNTGKIQRIDKKFIYSINSLGDNFIEIDIDGKKQIFLRKGSNKGTVKGTVKSYGSQSKIEKYNKPNSFENLKVTINDGFNKQTTIVKNDGSFNFEKVIVTPLSSSSNKQNKMYYQKDENNTETDTGDIIGDIELIFYDLYNSGDEKNNSTEVLQVDLTSSGIDNDFGNFYIPDSDAEEKNYNFKTTKILNNQDKDNRYMYENQTYSGELVFKNTGNTLAEGLNYIIKTDDPYVTDLTYDIKMGSVEANESVSIPFNITFGMLDKVQHKVKLDFIIRDVYKKEWVDNVYLDFYQTPIVVNIKTKTSKLQGYFVTPEHDIINIDTKNIAVTVPRRPDDKYFFVVSSPTEINMETAYSIGVDTSAPEFKNFQDTSIYEPNDSEKEATKLEVDNSIISFINKGDIDFYTIDFKSNISFTPPSLPFN